MSYVTVTEAAAKLGVSRQAVLKLIGRGTVPAFKRDQRLRSPYVIPSSAIDDRLAGAHVPDGWVTVATAAELRNRQPDAIREWIDSHGLPAERLADGRLVIERAALDEFPAPRRGPRGDRP